MCHLTVPSCRSEVQGHCSCIRYSGSYRAGVKVLAGPQFSPGALPAHWLLAESFSYHCRTEVPISLLGVSHRLLSASVDVQSPYHGTLSIFKPIMTSNSSQTLNESLTSFSVLSWRTEEPHRFSALSLHRLPSVLSRWPLWSCLKQVRSSQPFTQTTTFYHSFFKN